jgi:hypothetical protein
MAMDKDNNPNILTYSVSHDSIAKRCPFKLNYK